MKLLKTFILFFIILAALSSISYSMVCSPSQVMTGAYLFDTPGKMALTLDDKFLLVLDETGASVKVISTSDNVIKIQIDLSFDPADIIISNDGKIAYVSSCFQGNISLIDISDTDCNMWQVTTTWDIASDAGASLGSMAIDNETLYVADDTIHAIHIIGLSDGIKQQEPFALTSGSMISDVVIADNKLFASCEIGNMVAVFELQTMSFIKNILTDNNPLDLLASPDSSKIFVANSSSIGVIDTQSLAVIKTVKNANILSRPINMAWVDDSIWITDRDNGSVVKFNPEILDLEAESCDSIGSYPSSIVALESSGIVYVANRDGVNYFSVEGSIKLYVKKQEDTDYSRAIDLMLDPQEIFFLRIDGGSGSFEVTGTSGLKSEAAGDRIFTITGPIIEGYQFLYVEDNTTGEMVTLVLRVGSDLIVSPQAILDLELGGQSRVLNASGGFAPYKWVTDHGLLSSTTGRYVVYTPVVTGHDTVMLSDSAGTSFTVEIEVTISGVQITPAVAIMMPGEEREFTAFGGTNYSWEAPIGGEISETQGQTTIFTAPDTTQEFYLLLTDTLTEETSKAIITVVSDVLEITPSQIDIDREQSASFSVIGGKGPYLWSVKEGDLSSTQGTGVFYTAPKVSGQTEIQVMDIGGRIAVAKINIGSTMMISPISPALSKGESIDFSLSNATEDVSWTCSDGTLASTTNTGATWTAPGYSGQFCVVATDSQEKISQAVIKVVSNLVTVTPSEAQVKQGETVVLRASGGYSPYVWAANTGTLSASEGSTIYWTAPYLIDDNTYIIVEDSAGETAKVAITITSGNPGIWVSSEQDEYDNGDSISLKIKTFGDQWETYAVIVTPIGVLWFNNLGILQGDQIKLSDNQLIQGSWQTLLELSLPETEDIIPLGEYFLYGAIIPKDMDLFQAFELDAALWDVASFVVK